MDKSITPAISVLMPVYNASAFLREAIDSILNQTFSDFELLLFDDASTDSSIAIVNGFSDKRIKLISSAENKGYVFHLNEGIKMAQGKYIARMDADDISEKDRFDKQFHFMESNPDVGICGAQVMSVDEAGKILSLGHHYLTHEELRVRLLTDSCFAHPVVMIRKSVLTENHLRYKIEYAPAEDYTLWSELSLVSKLSNLPDLLLKYRVHPQQITQRKRIQQTASVAVTRRRLLENFCEKKISDEDFDFHNSLLSGRYECSKHYVKKAKSWILVLINKNLERGNYYDKSLFDKEMSVIWFTLCTHLYSLGPGMIYVYFSLSLNRNAIPKKMLIKFILKSITGINLSRLVMKVSRT